MSRLVGIIGLFLILGFSTTSFISFQISQDAIRKSIMDTELPVTSDTVYSEIQKDLVQPVFVSEMMAHDTFLRDWILNGEKDSTLITQYLAEIKERYQALTSFFISEETRNYYYSEGVLKKVDPQEIRDKWYFRVRDLKEPYEINVDVDLANKDILTVFVNFRVLDFEGNFIGVAGIGVSVDFITRVVKGYQNKYERIIYFVNASGTVLMSASDQHTVGQNVLELPSLKEQKAEILHNDQHSLQYEMRGKTIYLNTRLIPEIGWRLFVEKESDWELMGFRSSLFINLAIWLGMGILILVLISWNVKKYHKTIEDLAARDQLTGIYNRHAFHLLVAQMMKESLRHHSPLILLMADLDYFKKINDQEGHSAGDQYLKKFTSVVQGCLRASDLFCRWGGEEFVIILRNCDFENGKASGEKIREMVEKNHLSVSLGVAEWEKEESLDAWLLRSDQALYEAKERGRNCVVALKKGM